MAAVGIVPVRLHFPEVVAAAERRPLAGEHDDAGFFVLGDVGEGDDQRVDHRQAEGVAVLRGRERQGDDAAVVVAADEFGCRGGGCGRHGVFPKREGGASRQAYLCGRGQ